MMGLIGLAAAAAAVWGAVDGTAPPECNQGPVTKSFAGKDWNVYACAGHDALAAVPSATNTENAGSFVLVVREGGKFRVEGKAKGEAADRKAVVDGLSGAADFDRLQAEARKPKAGR